MSITSEQLQELADLINSRLAEFGQQMFDPLSAGVIRIMADEFERWQIDNPDPNDEGYGLGFRLGVQETLDAIDRHLAKLDAPVPQPEFNEFGADVVAATDAFGRGYKLGHKDGYAGGYVRAYRDALHPSAVIGTTPSVPEPTINGENGREAEPATEPDDDPYGIRGMFSEKPDAPPIAPFQAPIGVVSPAAAATLGPEHTMVTPLRPIISGARLPDPDEARDRQAIGLASGSADDPRVRTASSKPRTLAEVDAENDSREPTLPDALSDEDGDEPEIDERPLPFLPSRKQVIAELKRQAMAGQMPTQAAFDVAKPTNWAPASAQCLRLRVPWVQLAHEAGLTPNKRGSAANGASA